MAGSSYIGGCTSWTVSTETNLPVRLISEISSSISLTTYNIIGMKRGVESCHDKAATALIMTGLSSGFNTSTVCNSTTSGSIHTWYTKICGKGVTSLCVDCVDPCATDQCGNLNIINPCGPHHGSEYGCVAQNSSVNGYRILTASFIPLSPSPSILSIMINPKKMSVDILISLDQLTASPDGTVFCGSFPLGVKPTSTLDIAFQGFNAKSIHSLTNVTITGLLPLTNYDIYCYTTSNFGTKMIISESLQTRRSIKTLPFKGLVIESLLITMYQNTSALNSILLHLQTLPSESIFISIYTQLINSSISIPAVPASYVISSTDPTSYLFSLSSESTAQIGILKIFVIITGPSANEFEASFRSGKDKILVFSKTVPPPAPQLLSVVFSPDGHILTAIFDRETNKGKITGFNFPCSYFLSFVGSNATVCSWVGTKSVEIRLGTGAIVLPGDTLRFYGNDSIYGIQAMSLTEPADYTNYPYSTPVSLKILPPVSAAKPIIGISAPTTIGPNSSYILDLTSTSGGGGRPFRKTIFSVTSSLNGTRAQYFFDNKYGLFPPTPLPPGLFMSGSYNNIIVTVCNFLLQCDTAEASLTVTVRNPPIASISGGSILYITTEAGLDLNSNAYAGSPPSSAGLVYTWVLYQDGIQVFTIKDTSRQPYSYKLKPYTLSLHGYYTVVLTVVDSSTGFAATTSIAVLVIPSYIEGIIDGADIHTVSFGGNITLDASRSYDHDQFGKVDNQ